MKQKIAVILLCLVFSSVFVGCKLDDISSNSEMLPRLFAQGTQESDDADFPFDFAFYYTTKRNKNFLVFDTTTKNVIYISHGPNVKGKTVTNYREGTYSGDINTVFDVSITRDSDNSNTTHYKRSGNTIESYFADGSVKSCYSMCEVSKVKEYLEKTDYFD